MDRYYLIPLVGAGTSPRDPRRPKYVTELGVTYQGFLHGLEALALFFLPDLSDENHAAISKNPDVFSFPDLDSKIDPGTISPALSSFFLGTKFLDAAQTYGDLLTAIKTQMTFSQLYVLEYGERLFFDASAPLKDVKPGDSIGSLGLQKQINIAATATKYGYPIPDPVKTLDDYLSAVAGSKGSLPISGLADALDVKL